MPLNEEQKKQLDANIRMMLDKGATEADVQQYAADFKAKYDTQTQPVKKKEDGVSQSAASTSVGSDKQGVHPVYVRGKTYNVPMSDIDKSTGSPIALLPTGEKAKWTGNAWVITGDPTDSLVKNLSWEERDAYEQAKNELVLSQKAYDEAKANEIKAADRIDPVVEQKQHELFMAGKKLQGIETTAKFRDKDNYYQFYDTQTFEPTPIKKDEIKQELQKFMDEEFSGRRDIVNPKFEAKEFVGKSFDELDPSAKEVVLTKFMERYKSADELQQHMKSNNYDVELGQFPNMGKSFMKGLIGTTSAIMDGAAYKNSVADVMNANYAMAKNSMISKSEYERKFSELSEDILGEVKNGVYTSRKPLPGITPMSEGYDAASQTEYTYQYTEDQVRRWLAKNPTYEEVRNGAESPYVYEGGSLGEWADSVQQYADSIKSNPLYKDYVSTKFAEGLGSSIPFIATTVVGSMIGVPAGAITAVTGALANASGTYNDAIQSGATASEANKAYLFGLGIGATEAVPLERLMNKLGTGSIIKAFAQGGEEAIQESFTSLGNDALAKFIYDASREIGATVKSDGGIGFLTGLVMGGGAVLLGRKDVTTEQKEMVEEAMDWARSQAQQTVGAQPAPQSKTKMQAPPVEEQAVESEIKPVEQPEAKDEEVVAEKPIVEPEPPQAVETVEETDTGGAGGEVSFVANDYDGLTQEQRQKKLANDLGWNTYEEMVNDDTVSNKYAKADVTENGENAGMIADIDYALNQSDFKEAQAIFDALNKKVKEQSLTVEKTDDGVKREFEWDVDVDKGTAEAKKGELVVVDKKRDVLDEVTEEKVSEKPYQEYSIDFEDGARAFGKIEDGVATIAGIYAPQKDGKPIRGAKTYERVLNKLNESGVEVVSIKLQSSDSQKAIDKLIQKGVLTNPRDIYGSSGNERPTTFDIGNNKETEQTAITQKEKSVEQKSDEKQSTVETEERAAEPLEMEEQRVYKPGDVVQWNGGDAEVVNIGRKKGVEVVELRTADGKKVNTTKASLDIQQQGEAAKRELENEITRKKKELQGLKQEIAPVEGLNLGKADKQPIIRNKEFAKAVAKAGRQKNSRGGSFAIVPIVVDKNDNVKHMGKDVPADIQAKVDSGEYAVDNVKVIMDSKTLAPFKIIREGQYADRKTPQNRAQQLRDKAMSQEVFDAEDAVMQYFAGGGKIGSKAMSELFGVKGDDVATRRKIDAEAKGRGIADISKEGKGLEKMAESIHEDLPEHLREVISYDDILTELETAARDISNPADAQQRLVDKYAEQQQEAEELTDEERAQLDSLTPEYRAAMEAAAELDEQQRQEYAQRLRDKKIKGAFSAIDFGLTTTIYNGALEFMASQIEKGTKVGNAIAKTLKWIDDQMGGKKWDKGKFAKYANDTYTMNVGGKEVETRRDDSKEAAEVVNGFYSDIEQRVLDEKKADKKASEWLSVVGKGDEAVFTGVRDWLESKGDEQVHRDEIMQWMKDNRIEIREVVKSDKRGANTDWADWVARNADKFQEVFRGDEDIYPDSVSNDIDGNDDRYYISKSDMIDAGAPDYIIDSYESNAKTDTTKYSQYQLEGEKSDYKEVLVVLPSKVNPIENPNIKITKDFTAANGSVHFNVVDKSTGEKYKHIGPEGSTAESVRHEVLIKFDLAAQQRVGADFKSSHFDEPNILVHLRMNTRTDATGAKVLFLEEIQSDWAQKGRREGFAKLGVKEKLEKAFSRRKYLIELEGKYTDYSNLSDIKPKTGHEETVKSIQADLKELEKEIDNLSKLHNGGRLIPSAPFVTDTNAWVKLALKVAAKEAVKQGVDKIAWTTGEQQNERYDLSKTLSSVEWNPKTGNLVGYDKESHEAFSQKGVTESKLQDYIGKEAAEAILKKDVNHGIKRLENQELKVGGKGMNDFYGNAEKLGIVGKVAEALFGGNVVSADISTAVDEGGTEIIWNELSDGTQTVEVAGDTREFETEAEARAYVESLRTQKSGQPAIEITPEIVAEVKHGIPMLGNLKARIEQKKREIRELKDKMKSMGIADDSNEVRARLMAAYTDLAVSYIKYGVMNAVEFARELGEELTDLIQEAWDKAVEENLPKEEKKPQKEKKALLNRAYEGDNTQAIRDALKEIGLNYEPESWAEGRKKAAEFIEQLGIDGAIEALNKGMIQGSAAAFIYAEAVDRVNNQLVEITEGPEHDKLVAQEAELIRQFDEKARDAGRFISALRDVYANADFNYSFDAMRERLSDQQGGFVSPEQEQKLRELDEKYRNTVKQLQQAERKLKERQLQQAVDNIAADVDRENEGGKPIEYTPAQVEALVRAGVDAEIKKIHASLPTARRQKAEKAVAKMEDFRKKLKGMAFDATVGVPVAIIDAGVLLAEKALLTGATIADAVEAAIKHITEAHGRKWDWDKFRSAAMEHFSEAGYSEEEVRESKKNPAKPKRKENGRLTIPNSIIKDLVQSGIRDAKELVDAVMDIVREDVPDVTEREVRDAISGYGKVSNLSQEEVDKEVRKLKRALKDTSILEDIAEKKRPLRSGLQRDQMDAEERARQKQIKEALKDLPIDEEADAREQKSALDAIERRINNQIEDLQREIDTGERAVKEKKEVELPPHIQDLKQQRDRLKEVHKQIFGDPKKSDEQKLKAAKNAARESITNLQDMLATGNIFPSAKPTGPVDAELLNLRAQRDALREKLNDARNRYRVRKTKDQIRAEAKLRGLEKSIKTLEDKINRGDTSTAAKPAPVTNPQIEAAKARLQFLQEAYKQMEEEAGVPEKKRLEQQKKAAQRRIAFLEDKLRRKDVSKPAKKPIVQDQELINIKAERDKLQREYEAMLYESELRNRTWYQKAADALLEVWNLTRGLRATAEMSFVLIQGGFYFMSHPIQGLKALKFAGQAWASQRLSDKFEHAIKTSPYYQYIREDKLAITEPDVKLSKREEMYLTGWTNVIWDVIGKPLNMASPQAYEWWVKKNPFRAFERAATVYLNTVRLARYADGVRMLEAQGKSRETNPEDYKNMADMINTFTGRASLGKAEQLSKPLAIAFFSPRMWASVFKTFTPYAFFHFGKMTSTGVTGKREISVAQKMAMADYLKYVGLTMSLLMMIKAFAEDDDEVEVVTDPLNSDFMKVRIGNTRLDPWGGRQQMVVFQARFIKNAITRTGSDERRKLGTGFTETRWGLGRQMTRNKFSPSMQLLVKYLDQHYDKFDQTVDKYGNPIDMDEEVVNNLYPIYAETVAELLDEDKGALTGLLIFYGFFGGGMQTYQPKEKDSGKLKPLKPVGTPLKPLKPVQ